MKKFVKLIYSEKVYPFNETFKFSLNLQISNGIFRNSFSKLGKWIKKRTVVNSGERNYLNYFKFKIAIGVFQTKN